MFAIAAVPFRPPFGSTINAPLLVSAPLLRWYQNFAPILMSPLIIRFLHSEASMGGSTIVRSVPLAWALHSGLPSDEQRRHKSGEDIAKEKRFKANVRLTPFFIYVFWPNQIFSIKEF
jgi:hypothetical protein